MLCCTELLLYAQGIIKIIIFLWYFDMGSSRLEYKGCLE